MTNANGRERRFPFDYLRPRFLGTEDCATIKCSLTNIVYGTERTIDETHQRRYAARFR